MYKIFSSDLFIEIGEAIGGVRRKVRRRPAQDLVDRLFRKSLSELAFHLPEKQGRFVQPDDSEVIDVDYRVLDSEEERP